MFTLYSRKNSSNAEPVILLTIPIENGGEKIVEIPIKMFHILRKRTAVLMKYLITLQEQ